MYSQEKQHEQGQGYDELSWTSFAHSAYNNITTPQYSPLQLYQQLSSPPTNHTFEAQKSIDNNRWTKSQTDVLVAEWKDMYDALKSSNSRNIWSEICSVVNDVDDGAHKTVNQCKEKIRNMTTAYRKARDHNDKTGNTPKFSKYYDDFDAVLGTRDMITLPELKQCGFGARLSVISTPQQQIQQPDPVTSNALSQLSPCFSPSTSPSTFSPTLASPSSSSSLGSPTSPSCSLSRALVPTYPLSKSRKRLIKTNDDDHKSKKYMDAISDTKKMNAVKPPAPKRAPNKFDDLVDLQKQQLKSIENASDMQREFLRTMMKEQRDMEERDRVQQREMEERERQKDREFFLKLAEAFK